MLAELKIVPTRWDLDSIVVELPLVDLSNAAGAQPTQWELSSALQAEFAIRTEAVIPTTESPDTQSFKERRAAVRKFVKENLVVFVDVSGLDPDGTESSTTTTVQVARPARTPGAAVLSTARLASTSSLKLARQAEGPPHSGRQLRRPPRPSVERRARATGAPRAAIDRRAATSAGGELRRARDG